MNSPQHRATRGGRPAVLTHERIVAAAIDVIDAEGTEALSMRRLGAELGVAAMSLYRHLPNRDAVLAAVVNQHFRTALTAVTPAGTWAETVTRFAHGYRDTLLAHPRAVPLLATHPVDQEIGSTVLAGLLDQFAAAGVAPEDALNVIQSVAVYVLGHALAQAGTPPGTDAPTPVHDPATRQYYDRWFDAGLRALVGGFHHELGA